MEKSEIDQQDFINCELESSSAEPCAYEKRVADLERENAKLRDENKTVKETQALFYDETFLYVKQAEQNKKDLTELQQQFSGVKAEYQELVNIAEMKYRTWHKIAEERRENAARAYREKVFAEKMLGEKRKEISGLRGELTLAEKDLYTAQRQIAEQRYISEQAQHQVVQQRAVIENLQRQIKETGVLDQEAEDLLKALRAREADREARRKQVRERDVDLDLAAADTGEKRLRRSLLAELDNAKRPVRARATDMEMLLRQEARFQQHKK